jgi:sugar lactone lactonase YvrE
LGLLDGVETGRLDLPRTPEAVVLSPDGARLYVAGVVRPHDHGWFDPQEGYLMVVDPTAWSLVAEYAIDIDPLSLAATDDGLVAVGGGSGQWTRLVTFDARQGTVTGSESGVVYMFNRLTLHSSQQWLYLGDLNSLQRLDLDPDARYFRHLDDQVFSVSQGKWRTYLLPGSNWLLDSSGRILALSAVRTNDLQSAHALPVTEITAAAMDPWNHSVFVVDGVETLHRFHSETLLPAGSYTLSQRPFELLATSNVLYAVASHSEETVFTVFVNPARGGATNQPPTASFSWAPEVATTIAPVLFDAGGSTDDGLREELTYSWDWNDDGIFEVAFTNAPVASRGFNMAGSYPVTLRVTDRHGAAATLRKEVGVVLVADPGRTNVNHLAFELPFEAQDIVFDPVRPRLYASDILGNRVVSVNLDTGRVDRQYDLFHPADGLAVTPDGRWLYAGLLTRTHDMFYFDEQHGFIAEFDLQAGVKTREFPIEIDPWDLAATDGRKLVISSGSGQFAHAVSYDAESGELRSRFQTRAYQPVLLHPAGDRVLFLSAHTAGSNATEYSVDPLTGALGEARGLGNLTVQPPFLYSPDGGLLVSHSGFVFPMVPGATGDVAPLATLAERPFTAVLFDAPQRPVCYASAGLHLHLFHARTFEWIGSVDLPHEPRYLGRLGTRLFTASVAGGVTRLHELPNPALGSEGNLPPVARLEVPAGERFTRRPVVFDAGGSTDDPLAPPALVFRWDLDGDGIYDTTWGNTVSITREYLLPGTYRVGVEVRDEWGETAQAHQTVVIHQGVDAGVTPSEHDPWVLPFATADVAFDPVRPRLWLSDATQGAVVRLDLETGRMEKRWDFPHPVESLAVTPDGRRLYAAVLVHPHDPYWFDQTGYIAEFDLEMDALLRVFSINLDPGDLAATDNGLLLVAGASGQWTYVQAHTVATGAMVGQTPMYNGATLRLAPSQQMLFAGAVWNTPRVQRLGFNANTGALSEGAMSTNMLPEINGAGWQVFVLPGETRLLGNGGGIFTNRPGAANDLRVTGTLGMQPILDYAVLPGRTEFVVSDGPNIGIYRSDTLAPLSVLQLGRPARFLGARPEAHFAVSIDASRTHVARRAYPATDPATNRPPSLVWLSPTNGFVSQYTMPLTVIPEDADGGIQRVEFWRQEELLGSVTNHPFTLGFYTIPYGDHVLTARVVDNLGATSAPVDLRLRLTQPPVIRWITPTQPMVLDAGADSTLEVAASDPDGTVSRVEFYRDNFESTNLLGVVLQAPWVLDIEDFEVTTAYFGRAVDNDGVTSDTPAVLVQLAGPAGDEFYRPFELAGLDATARFSNHTATVQRFETPLLTGASQQTVWWTWTAPTNGIYHVTTRGSSFDTVLGIYTGTNIAALTKVGLNNDALLISPSSLVKFTGIAGRQYRIVVDGFRGAVGNVQLTLTLETPLPTPPPNDAFSNRLPLAGSEVNLNGVNVAATSESGEPGHAGLPAGPSVWFEWTAPTNGTVQVVLGPVSFDSVLAVYTLTGTTLSTLRALTGNDDDPTGGVGSRVLFHGVAGTRYYIAVTGYAGATGTFAMRLEQTLQPEGPPANDDFVHRIPMQGARWQVEGSNVGATVEPQEPRPSLQSSRATVWWSWRASGSGKAYIVVVGGGFTARVAVMTGTAVNALETLVISMDSAINVAVDFDAVAGRDYAIAVDGTSGSTGPFLLFFDAPSVLGTSRITLGRSPGGAPALISAGDWSGTGVILRSTDFDTWQPISTNVFTPGVAVPLPEFQQPMEFFRLQIE